MKLQKIVVMIAASITATSAIGALGESTASASPTNDSLCIINSSHNTDVCAIANGSNAIRMVAPQSSTTNWTAVPVTIPVGDEIRQANTTSCMQLDHNGGNIVIMAACDNKASYQQWSPITTILGTQIESDWDLSLCLTYNASGHDLKVGGCGNDWYQEFTGD